MAKHHKQGAVVALLEEHYTAKFPLYAAARTGDVEAMTQLLDGGAAVDKVALFVTCEHGHVDVVRLLLDKGAEVDRGTETVRRCIVACEHGRVDAARLLLERGAVFEHDSSALCEGDAVEAKYRGREKYYPGKISRDRGEGKYDIAYDDGDREKNVEARLIRKLPLSPLAIAKENGHSAVVALLEESSRG